MYLSLIGRLLLTGENIVLLTVNES
ncbi:hypothetical protein PanWU01x14_263090 [Parasponia andersonii]|uniref:Uncharacterized protein n=1 Tax=Parasponia andersonii TaxID=3476 RepID=A0A2P5B856_PARAD|nr:hypothetical protein PanWU01x14_263090 [Parasponia andersonii]